MKVLIVVVKFLLMFTTWNEAAYYMVALHSLLFTI